MPTYSGTSFNTNFQNKVFVKLTNDEEKEEIDDDDIYFHYLTGLNENNLEFDQQDNVKSGGIRFYDINEIGYHLKTDMKYIRYITIPNDAKVNVTEHEYFDYDVYKTDKLILSERKLISDMTEWNDTQFRLNTYSKGGIPLKYIDNQTHELCLEAVKIYGIALEYVKDQTEELCLIALDQCAEALRCIRNQTDKLCMTAIEYDCNGNILRHVKNKTYEICKRSIERFPRQIKYVEDDKFQDGSKLTESEKDDLRSLAIKSEGLTLFYIKNKTPEICLAAVKQNPEAIKYINDEFKEYVGSHVDNVVYV
jgi:hypothetical protein